MPSLLAQLGCLARLPVTCETRRACDACEMQWALGHPRFRDPDVRRDKCWYALSS